MVGEATLFSAGREEGWGGQACKHKFSVPAGALHVSQSHDLNVQALGFRFVFPLT